MATISLVLEGKSYPVSAKSAIELLHHDPDLLDTQTYCVRSSVPRSVFQAFVDSLNSQTNPSVTKENVTCLSLLAKEFFLSELSSACASFSVWADQFSNLADRVSLLERQVSVFSNRPQGSEDNLQCQEEGLENLRLEIVRLKQVLHERETVTPVVPLRQTASESPESPTKVEILMKEDNSVDGIISYLTTKHGGNVDEKGIVTITSKSRMNQGKSPNKLADLADDSWFSSDSQPGQWICWDFHERRVRLTHYTLWIAYVKSWVLEGSPDGETWTEIDRQTDNQDFTDVDLMFPKAWKAVSFAVSDASDFRFIRLTQTDMDHRGSHYLLCMRAVEFFGTLSE
jgi:hypothetical protein